MPPFLNKFWQKNEEALDPENSNLKIILNLDSTPIPTYTLLPARCRRGADFVWDINSLRQCRRMCWCRFLDSHARRKSCVVSEMFNRGVSALPKTPSINSNSLSLSLFECFADSPEILLAIIFLADNLFCCLWNWLRPPHLNRMQQGKCRNGSEHWSAYCSLLIDDSLAIKSVFTAGFCGQKIVFSKPIALSGYFSVYSGIFVWQSARHKRVTWWSRNKTKSV